MTDTNDAVEAAAERDFQRKKVIFEQDCQEFRSLNGFLWQIPVIVSTLTGGLWFGAGKIDGLASLLTAVAAFIAAPASVDVEAMIG